MRASVRFARAVAVRPARQVAGLGLVLAVAVGLGACALLPGALSRLDPATPLVVFETTGGECPQGPCGFRAEIFRDGRVVRSDGLAQTVDAAALARLVAQVDAADWPAILARPFEGECPTAFDGQEQTYTFNVAPAPVVVASCTVAIDPRQEPFQTVQGILFAAGG